MDEARQKAAAAQVDIAQTRQAALTEVAKAKPVIDAAKAQDARRPLTPEEFLNPPGNRGTTVAAEPPAAKAPPASAPRAAPPPEAPPVPEGVPAVTAEAGAAAKAASGLGRAVGAAGLVIPVALGAKNGWDAAVDRGAGTGEAATDATKGAAVAADAMLNPEAYRKPNPNRTVVDNLLNDASDASQKVAVVAGGATVVAPNPATAAVATKAFVVNTAVNTVKAGLQVTGLSKDDDKGWVYEGGAAVGQKGKEFVNGAQTFEAGTPALATGASPPPPAAPPTPARRVADPKEWERKGQEYLKALASGHADEGKKEYARYLGQLRDGSYITAEQYGKATLQAQELYDHPPAPAGQDTAHQDPMAKARAQARRALASHNLPKSSPDQARADAIAPPLMTPAAPQAPAAQAAQR